MAKSLLKSKSMPSYFWGEAVTTVVYLLNHAPTKSIIRKTPYEAWFQRKPNVHHSRTFGYLVHVKPVTPFPKKLADQSTPMILLGY